VLFEFPLLERPFRLSLAEMCQEMCASGTCSRGAPAAARAAARAGARPGGARPGTRAEEVLLSVGAITAVSLLDPPLDQVRVRVRVRVRVP